MREGWSRVRLRGGARALGVGLSPHRPTHQQDKVNNDASSRVQRMLVYFGHFPQKGWERGRPRAPGASLELLGVPSRSLGEPLAARTAISAAPEKIRRFGRREPPFLPSSAAGRPAPAQTRRRGTGFYSVAPEIRSTGPGGARAERAEQRPAESDAPGGAEAAAAARPPSAPPCPRSLGNTPWKKIFQGIF